MANCRFAISFRFILILFSIMMLLAGCGGGGGDGGAGGEENGSSPAITNFTPSSGQAGDNVTITGTNFSPTPADNAVSFHGTAAVVTSCTSTQIVTAVPTGAATGPITVSVGSKSATSSTDFIVNASLPALPIAGYYNDGLKDIPCYWNGTTRIDLAGDGVNDAYAFSPTVSSGGMVYAAGYYYDGLTDLQIPCYWAGTARTDLGDGTNNAYAYSIAVSGGTVYTAGFYYDIASDRYIPCYWTGTIRTDLPSANGNHAFASSIVISGGTVYTAGYYFDGTKQIPCYWTGTTRTDLGDGTKDAYAYSIAVSGGTVYTAGYYFDYDAPNNMNMWIPCYWTGATRTDLPNVNSNQAYATSIAISGGTVYTAGFYVDAGGYYKPCYWAGTNRTDLAGGGNNHAYAYFITVSGNTVYTAGYYLDDSADRYRPCCWTGTDRTDLDNDTNNAFIISPFWWWLK
jgi:hypothetical protein